MKTILLKTVIVVFLFTGCNKHAKCVVELTGYNDTHEIVYDTHVARYYFSKRELEKYCEEQNNGRPNSSDYVQVLNFIHKNRMNPVVISDTLGTKMDLDPYVKHFKRRDTLVRIRNQESPYSFVTDTLRWTLIDFAKSGRLKVFDKRSNQFVPELKINEVETDSYGATEIYLLNDSLLLSQLNWIK